MKNKIAFICLNSWERLLSPSCLCHVREYYEWFTGRMRWANRKLCCEERMESYGETDWNSTDLTWKDSEEMQILYIQCSNLSPLENLMSDADLLIIGMSESRKVCDSIFLKIFPWKEKSIFLWDGSQETDPTLLKQCQREYLLKDEQIIKTKSFCRSDRSFDS